MNKTTARDGADNFYWLKWLQDNRDVLVFATATDVRALEARVRTAEFTTSFRLIAASEDRREIQSSPFQTRSRSAIVDPKKLSKIKDFSGAEIEGGARMAFSKRF